MSYFLQSKCSLSISLKLFHNCEIAGPHKPVLFQACNNVHMSIISLLFITNLEEGLRIGKGKSKPSQSNQQVQNISDIEK